MKKIIFFIFMLFLISSCSLFEDSKINTEFLIGSYDKETHQLNLSNNKLTQIPNFEKYLTGSYIDDVWSIDLSNNNIDDIDSNYLNYFPNLKDLNLSYNNIENTTIKHNFLQDIKLHKNKLNKIDLSGITKLDSVNLGYNEFKSGKDIKLPKDIKTLELQHNKLLDLSGILELKKLEKLKIEFNNLEDKDLKNLLKLKDLKFISVKYNKFSKELEKKLTNFTIKNMK